MKTVAVVQSCYLPWKGYFDLIAAVDEFILYDSAQFTRRDWRNRNRIKTAQGLCWLTIPLQQKGQYAARICDMRTSDPRWAARHLATIRHHYAAAPYFAAHADWIAALYATLDTPWLSEINAHFLRALCARLGITTPINSCLDYTLPAEQDATERLLALCRQAGATRYLSGPAARAYLRAESFAAAGIDLRYMDYTGYPEYRQRFGPFEHAVSIIDLLLNTGDAAHRHLLRGQLDGMQPAA